MIGQQYLQMFFESSDLPRFMIIVGVKGCGKKTIIKECLSKRFDTVYEVGTTIDAIRDVKEKAQLYAGIKTLYVIADADNMSINAKNALLKLLEEPPRDAYFVMTLMDEGNTLETILSRAIVIPMMPYMSSDIVEYVMTKCGKRVELLERLCSCPGEVDALMDNVEKFYEYVQKVVNNIDKVSGSNSFKIGANLNLGDDETKYDLGMFWRAFITECMARLHESTKYAKGVLVTDKYLRNLRQVGINKQMLFDNWLLEVRAEWFDYAEN